MADRISIPFPFQGNKIHPIRMFNVQAMEHRFRFHPQNKIFPRVNIAWNIQRKESFIAKTLTSRVVIFSLFSYGSVLCLLWNEVTCETREGNSRYPIPKLNKIVPPRPNIYSPVWLLRFLSHRGRYTSEDKKMKILNKSSLSILHIRPAKSRMNQPFSNPPSPLRSVFSFPRSPP